MISDRKRETNRLWRKNNPGRVKASDAVRGRRYRDAHPERTKAQSLAATKQLAARNRTFIDAMKAHPCMDCGGTFDPICMDFDHRPGEVKVSGLAHMVTWSRVRIIAEIAKCDLVCANCHRLRTHRQRPPQKRMEPRIIVQPELPL